MKPPLPDNPSIRLRLIYNKGTAGEGGNRFYMNYSGTAPTAANCATIATDVAAAWLTHMAPVTEENYYLNEVDCLDIATDMGASGTWSGANQGSDAGAAVPASVSMNIDFTIAERYRGGKPRIYLPPPSVTGLGSVNQWSTGTLTSVNSAWSGFINEVLALSVGAVGTLSHVLLSYYSGVYTTSPPWRGPGYKYPPKYRDTAMSLPITGYAAQTIVGSQRRRRTATSP
jgi:hypothetical protein